jgi:heme/copper-type cytochrome/quinol oxidase subunit 2
VIESTVYLVFLGIFALVLFSGRWVLRYFRNRPMPAAVPPAQTAEDVAAVVGWSAAAIVGVILLVFFWHFFLLCACVGLILWCIRGIISDGVADGIRKARK